MKKHILIEPVWQTIWQWPAVVNLICGGAACGFYLINMLAESGPSAAAGLAPNQVAHLAAPLLVLIGFAAVGAEAARPMAAKYLLHHLRTSWMSREVLAGSLFILFCVLDMLFPRYPLKIAAALSAIALLFSQSMMVYRCRAATAWNQSITLLHFLVSGIYLGLGLLLILGVPNHNALDPIILWIGLFASMASLAIWHRFVFSSSNGSQFQALEPLRQTMPLTLTIGLGHLLPLAMLLIFLLCTELEFDFEALKNIYVLTGMTIVFGSSAQKYYIILRANLLREIFAESCAKHPLP